MDDTPVTDIEKSMREPLGIRVSTDTTAVIGGEIAKALTAAGLPADWDGTPGRAIKISAMDWRKRLPQ